jgi:hypothetical protein
MDAGVLPLHVFPHQAGASLRPADVSGPLAAAWSPEETVERRGQISLIIPTFFNAPLKQRALERVLAGMHRSQVVQEVVLPVAGDPGQHIEVPRLQELLGDLPLRVASSPPNQRALTRNVGAAAARHDYLMFLDDDMLLRDWRLVDVILSRMLEGDFECALFPRRQYARFPQLFDAAALDRTIEQWRAGTVFADDAQVYDPWTHGCQFKMVAFCFPGCFTLVQRKAFASIGGFPEDFTGWGFEDTVFAMRAVARLRVLNLFRRTDPLLHIDHPVSPYKSEEYGQNGRKFFSSYSAFDVEWLCERVMGGEDFSGAGERAVSKPRSLRLWQELARHYSLPLVLRELEETYLPIVQRRLTAGHTAQPEHVILHGSRGRGGAGPDSDFDLLCLYRGGHLREFFVCQEEAQPRVEIEFADQAKFEEFACRPAMYPLNGPLELSKIAQGLPLWGRRESWQAWVQQVLNVGAQQGRELWLLVVLGLALHAEKGNELRRQYTEAVQRILARADADRYAEDLRRLSDDDLGRLAAHITACLNSGLPEWQAEVQRGRRVFAFQIPEVWIALQWLVKQQAT